MTATLALSLRQPWASLVVEGLKRFETRPWSTRHRGRLLIHAAQPISQSSIPVEVQRLAEFLWGHRWIRNLPFGAIVGEVELVDVLTAASVRLNLERRERVLGDFDRNRFAWLLRHPKRWTVPMTYAGRPRLFQADPEAARAFVHRLGEPVPSWWAGPIEHNAGIETQPGNLELIARYDPLRLSGGGLS